MSSLSILTREQLAKFLPNHQAIVAFEKALLNANDVLPSTVETLQLAITGADLSASQAQALAQVAIALIVEVTNLLAPLAIAPVLVQPIDQADYDPPLALGSMASQMADRVNISGGSVFATQLKNAQTTALVESTVALANGAAAAAGTLLNAPVAGNPTKWFPIIDNGLTRYVPAW